MMEKRLKEDIPNPGDVRPGLQERLCSFIIKACARKQEERFQSVRDAMVELELIAEEMGLRESDVVRQHMSSLFLFYTEEQRSILSSLLEEFSQRASDSGIRMQLADFENINAVGTE
jgi:hypothetical protein